MRIAILSDIHGNNIAFEAVLEDINNRGIEEIIIAGDHFNDIPQPMQVFNNIIKTKAWIIKGNKEERVLNYHNGKFPEWNSYLQMASFLWTYKQFNAEVFDYMEKLPEQIVIDLPKKDSIRVVHGSPFQIDELLYPDKDNDRIIKSLDYIEEKVLIYGHIHTQWHRRIADKLIINPGSVGISYNEKGFAEYSIIEWNSECWEVRECLVKYDKLKLEQEFQRSGYLVEGGAFARAVLSSIKRNHDEFIDFINFAYKLAKGRGHKGPLVPNDIWLEADKIWNWK